MHTLTTTVARILFALPFIAFGLLHFSAGPAMAAAVPVPGGVFWVYLIGACLLAGGLAIAANRLGQWAALGIAALMLVFVASVHAPGLGNPGMRDMAMMGLLKDLGLCGGALAWAGIFARQVRPAARPIG